MSAIQILVVEDERLVAAALKNELNQFGYGVSAIASDADDAVDKAIKGKPDLILMDIHLKGKADGIDAAHRIHNRCGIPVVYLSAFSDPATVARASETGAYGYLLKPYEEQELRTTIEMAIAKHRAEQQLEETRRWLAAIHNGIDEAIVAVDPDLKIRFINPVAEKLTNWRKEDAVGVPVTTVCRLTNDLGQSPLANTFDQVVQLDRTMKLPAATRIVSKDGRELPIEGGCTAIHDSHGDFLGMVLTIRDISARLELERLRQQDEERSRRAQKMDAASRLAGGLSRHLNDLLTVILGNTSLALTTIHDEPETTDSLQQVETAAQHAAQIVHRMTLLSTLSRRPASQFQTNDLNDLLIKCLKDIEPRLDHRVSLIYNPKAGSWPVAADELLLGQALLELVLNAEDAMPEGGQLLLDVENVAIAETDLPEHPEGRVGEFVRLRIRDTGHGMTPAVRACIFQPCFTTKQAAAAAGLGLALVHAVVEQFHGWIECDSRLNSGTRFDWYFPRYAVESSTPRAGIHQRQAGAAPTILLADADSMVRDVGRRILEADGYRVLLAEDGTQAVAINKQEEQIDLAILDLNLPRLSAYTVMERVIDLNPEAKVLFSGAYFTEDLTGTKGHTQGVIKKPFRQTELLEMVRRALAIHPAS